MARRDPAERVLRQVEDAVGAPPSERASRLRVLLESRHAVVAARVAEAVRDHALSELEGALVAAYDRFLRDPTKSDPGCQVKVSILEALDHLGRTDPEPFLSATRYVQREKRWGSPEDTAVGVRVRGVLALVRLRHDGVLLVLGELLADAEPRVRAGAAQALGHHGDPQGAALALLRLRSGEEDPEVLTECVKAFCVLAPGEADRVLDPMLRDPALRELAAHASIAANEDAALDVLIAFGRDAVLATERLELVQALGVSRRPRVREFLLGLVAQGGASDAEAALRGLAVHSFDPRLARSVREAAGRNASVDLSATLRECFPE